MAKVVKTYEAVCDFLAQDQFLDFRSREFYLNLKPKLFKVLVELAHEADLFADAKGGVPLCVTKGQHENKVVGRTQPKVEPKQDQRLVVICKICGKPKVSKGAKIRNRYNQVPHLSQDTNGKVTNS